MIYYYNLSKKNIKNSNKKNYSFVTPDNLNRKKKKK